MLCQNLVLLLVWASVAHGQLYALVTHDANDTDFSEGFNTLSIKTSGIHCTDLHGNGSLSILYRRATESHVEYVVLDTLEECGEVSAGNPNLQNLTTSVVPLRTFSFIAGTFYGMFYSAIDCVQFPTTWSEWSTTSGIGYRRASSLCMVRGTINSCYPCTPTDEANVTEHRMLGNFNPIFLADLCDSEACYLTPENPDVYRSFHFFLTNKKSPLKPGMILRVQPFNKTCINERNCTVLYAPPIVVSTLDNITITSTTPLKHVQMEANSFAGTFSSYVAPRCTAFFLTGDNVTVQYFNITANAQCVISTRNGLYPMFSSTAAIFSSKTLTVRDVMTHRHSALVFSNMTVSNTSITISRCGAFIDDEFREYLLVFGDTLQTVLGIVMAHDGFIALGNLAPSMALFVYLGDNAVVIDNNTGTDIIAINDLFPICAQQVDCDRRSAHCEISKVPHIELILIACLAVAIMIIIGLCAEDKERKAHRHAADEYYDNIRRTKQAEALAAGTPPPM